MFHIWCNRYNKLLAMSVVSKKVNYKHAIAILCTTISYDAKCVNVKLIKLSPPINVFGCEHLVIKVIETKSMAEYYKLSYKIICKL